MCECKTGFQIYMFRIYIICSSRIIKNFRRRYSKGTFRNKGFMLQNYIGKILDTLLLDLSLILNQMIRQFRIKWIMKDCKKGHISCSKPISYSITYKVTHLRCREPMWKLTGRINIDKSLPYYGSQTIP